MFTAKHGDGAYPVDGLVQDAAGNLYGTTQQGGTKEGYGAVFEVSASGVYTTLHAFQNLPTDGQFPFTGLTIGSNGDLYGTTEVGGAYGVGVVFKIALKK